ncbi:hypothetical protein [Paenibacillus lactis]|uniref:hypothetical protein n=1 Tax=Paenibacillus lactis TaxID=228574 RepID=UPI003D712D50
MGKVYIIVKTDFDTWENELGNAIYKTNVGYEDDFKKANNMVDQLNQDFSKRYKGWDDIEYPYYQLIEIPKFDIMKLNEFGDLVK